MRGITKKPDRIQSSRPRVKSRRCGLEENHFQPIELEIGFFNISRRMLFLFNLVAWLPTALCTGSSGIEHLNFLEPLAESQGFTPQMLTRSSSRWKLRSTRPAIAVERPPTETSQRTNVKSLESIRLGEALQPNWVQAAKQCRKKRTLMRVYDMIQYDIYKSKKTKTLPSWPRGSGGGIKPIKSGFRRVSRVPASARSDLQSAPEKGTVESGDSAEPLDYADCSDWPPESEEALGAISVESKSLAARASPYESSSIREPAILPIFNSGNYHRTKSKWFEIEKDIRTVDRIWSILTVLKLEGKEIIHQLEANHGLEKLASMPRCRSLTTHAVLAYLETANRAFSPALYATQEQLRHAQIVAVSTIKTFWQNFKKSRKLGAKLNAPSAPDLLSFEEELQVARHFERPFSQTDMCLSSTFFLAFIRKNHPSFYEQVSVPGKFSWRNRVIAFLNDSALAFAQMPQSSKTKLQQQKDSLERKLQTVKITQPLRLGWSPNLSEVKVVHNRHDVQGVDTSRITNRR